jgi:hypothetical protein
VAKLFLSLRRELAPRYAPSTTTIVFTGFYIGTLRQNKHPMVKMLDPDQALSQFWTN